eukprot:1365731-Amorphochlora_amoeboformis.AAC.1
MNHWHGSYRGEASLCRGVAGRYDTHPRFSKTPLSHLHHLCDEVEDMRAAAPVNDFSTLGDHKVAARQEEQE